MATVKGKKRGKLVMANANKQKLRGADRMRERGKKSVTAWLTAKELAVVKRLSRQLRISNARFFWLAIDAALSRVDAVKAD